MVHIYNLLTAQQSDLIHGWIPAQPLQDSSIKRRLHDAWAVWTGKALAVKWPTNEKE